MADLTASKTTYGYRCTGGADNTLVFSGTIWVKKFSFIPATNNNAIVITDALDNNIDKIIGPTAASSNERWFGKDGVCFNGLKVDLAEATDILHIFVK